MTKLTARTDCSDLITDCQDALLEAFNRGAQSAKHLFVKANRELFEAGWMASYARGGGEDLKLGNYLMERDWQAYQTVERIPIEK